MTDNITLPISAAAERVRRRTPLKGSCSAPVFMAGRSVAPRAFRPFGSSQMSWHAAAMVRPHKSGRSKGLLRHSVSHLASRAGGESCWPLPFPEASIRPAIAAVLETDLRLVGGEKSLWRHP